METKLIKLKRWLKKNKRIISVVENNLSEKIGAN